MAWSLSGSVITQSGVDTDLSGLAGIAGVTASILPTVRGITFYNLGNRTLRINGELDWNPEREACVTTNAKGVTIAGTLRINGAIERDGIKTYSEQYWLRSSAINNSVSGGYNPNFAIIHVLATGTLIWEGGYVAKAGSMVFDDASTIRITRGGWNCHAHFATYPDQVRMFTPDIKVDGFRFLDGGSWTDMVKPLTDNFGGFEFHHAYGFGLSGSQFDDDFHVYRDYSAINEKAGGGFWSNVPQDFVNAQNGSDMIVVGFSATSSANNVGYWQARKELKLSLQADEVTTAGTKVWVVDTDDGFRQNWTRTLPNTNYVDDRIYLETTTATSGNSSETDVFSILLASAVRQTGGVAGANDAGLNKKSYRGKNGDTSDIFEFRFCGYLTELKQTDLQLKGNRVLSVADKLFTDTSVTEQNVSTVAAYTEIDTATRLYDRAKLWLLENYAGETATLITRFGNTVDLRALNLVIDATAAAAFAFDGSTITIKASTFSGNLTTTGTVTLQNGETVTGSILDANGVLFAVSGLDPQSLGTTWTLGYITETDYQARDQTAAPATWTGWSQISGTGNAAQVQLAQDTAYRLFHRAPGYDNTAEATVDTGEAFSTVLTPIADRDLQGSLLWPQTAAHTAKAANFSYNPTDDLVDYDNQTGSTDYISFLAGYRAFGDIVFSPALTFSLRFLPRVSATKDGFVIDRDAALTLRMSDGSDASAILEADLAYTDGDKAYDRLIANGNHPYLLYAQMSAVLSSSSVQQVASAVDQSTVLAKEASVEVVNRGVKRASLIIPHTEDV